MSILHIFKVTDSRWKKSSWATSSICLCHSISSTAAFSQMMQKLLPQLQHPLLFFPSPSSSGPTTAQSQPFLPAESLARCQFKGQKYVTACSLLESQPNIAILRPGPAVQRPLPFPASAFPSLEPQLGLWRGWKTLLLPTQLPSCLLKPPLPIGWAAGAALPWCPQSR